MGQGFLSDQLSHVLRDVLGKIVIIADCAVIEFGRSLARTMGVSLLTMPQGEIAKNEQTVSYLMKQLFELGIGKDGCLIALGGGVTTDLVGFIASIYMRGISLVLIPTTLLGCVDASIGGKTAIDTPFGKNTIGTIYHPKAVFIDLDLLQSLPRRQWMNGFAEILKIALVYDPKLWDLAKTNKENLSWMIQAIEAKIGVIEQDPQDQSLRRILNFGHTIGHGLEKVANYQIDHGQAVALGSLTEAYLSMELGYLSSEDFEQIQEVYQIFSLRLPPLYRRDQFLQALSFDKKNALGKIRFVLIDRIGSALKFDGAYVRVVSVDQLRSSLDWMESNYL